jgi:polar amino acid transport system substrate-binding protein
VGVPFIFFIKSVCIFLLLLSSNCLSGEQQQPSLRIVTENMPPYNYTDAQGQLSGISTKIVLELLKNIDNNLKIEVFPWARAYKIATSQPNVLIYSIRRSPEREKKFHWLAPILPANLNLYALPDSPKLHDLNHLNHKIIGLLRGSPHLNLLRPYINAKEVSIVEVVTIEQLYEMLMLRRIDYLMAPTQVVNYLNQKFVTKETSRPIVMYKIPVIDQEGVYLALSKLTDTKTVAFIKDQLELVLNKEEIKHMIREFKSN